MNIYNPISKFSDWCCTVQEYNVKSEKKNKGKKVDLKDTQY